MSDEADDAGYREEQARAEALGRRRPEAPPACGACLFCGEALRAGMRWCDRHCRDDWERRAGRIAPGAAIAAPDEPT